MTHSTLQPPTDWSLVQELIDKAMAALDGGAGRPPIRKDRPILRYVCSHPPFFPQSG